MRAYVYFTEQKFNIGSVLDGEDITETIFGSQMSHSGDRAFMELDSLPRVGERIFLNGVTTLECEVVEICHQINVGANTHSTKIILNPLHISRWLKY